MPATSSLQRWLIATSFAFALPMSALAEPSDAPAMPPPHGALPHPPGVLPMSAPLPPFLHGIRLSEEQQDQVFAILHDATPAFRDLDKAHRRAGEELHQYAWSPRYDEAGLKIRAELLGGLLAKRLIQQVRIDRQILALLTPEQLRQAAERPAKNQAPR